jgi:hypothetical protein
MNYETSVIHIIFDGFDTGSTVKVLYTHSFVPLVPVQYNDSHRCVWVGSFI